MNNTPKKKPFYFKLLKPVGILLLLAVIMLMGLKGCDNSAKRKIESSAQPVIAQVSAALDADSVDCRVVPRPGAYYGPWDQRYYVFLNFHCSNLRSMTTEQISTILKNNKSEGDRVYGYDSWDDSIYFYEVNDPVTGKSCPILITAMDGNLSYHIKRSSGYSSGKYYLTEGDAYRILHPTSSTLLIDTVIPVVFLLVLLMGLLIYFAIKYQITEKEKETEKHRRQQLEEADPLGRILLKADFQIDDIFRRQDREALLKRIGIGAGIAATVILVVVLVVNLLVIPGAAYNQAMAQYNAGNLDAAYDAFRALDGFRDSEDICLEIDYVRACDLMDQGQASDAYSAFMSLDGYKDSAAHMESLAAQKPSLQFFHTGVGEIITFGEYEQDGDESNGKEPIEWIVLENEDGKIHLLSNYVLDCQPFNQSNTHNCTLQGWIQSTFYDAAFANADQDIITRAGLLPEGDLDYYNLSSEQIKASYTAYAKSQDPHSGYAAGLMWWLTDSSLFQSNGEISGPVVWENGAHGAHSCNVTERCGVRPDLWLFADEDEIPPEFVFSGNTAAPRRSSSSNSTTKRPCSGGSVSCRAGYHPCHEMANGYCNQCCKD